MNNKQVCFVYWDPHSAHKRWAESVNSQFYSFVPFNSRFIKSNGLLMHICAFFKALFFLPIVDVYFLESPMMITAVLCRTLFSSSKKVISVNSDPFFWILPKRMFPIREIFSLLIKRIDGYISPTQMMDDLASKTGKKHEIAEYMVDSSYFSIKPIISKDVCFIGPNLDTKKGVDILIDAFSELPQQDSRTLYLIGDVSEKIIIDKISNRRNIVVTGRISDPKVYLSKCGIYCNLARFEPAGINILESMAAGIAPIVSEYCGYASVVKQISPRLVVPLDTKTIIDTIMWLENFKGKKNLGKNSKELAARFTKQRSIDTFKRKFNKLTSDSSY